MSQRDQLNYLTPAHYMFSEGQGKWYVFGPMPLFKAVLDAVGKYRTNHEPCVIGGPISLIGIDAILAVRQRADFPITLTAEAPSTETANAKPNGNITEVESTVGACRVDDKAH